MHHAMLLLILGLAFFIAFIPHRDYAYPMHVDEWVHMTRAEAIIHTGSLTFTDPFSGNEATTLSSNLEASFQLFWGVFKTISGISWLTIFRYFPSIIFMLTVLSVYTMARREGFGLEAAFFTLLIPSTVGVLGPAFLVPVSLGLLFTPLILFLALNFRTVWSYGLIFIFICFLLAIHAPSAISPIIVLAPYILLNLKGNFKHSLGLSLVLILPFLIIFPWIISMLLPTARGLLIPQQPAGFVQLPQVMQTYGYLPSAFCLIGVFVLANKSTRKSYAIILGLLALLLMLVAFITFHYGVEIVYQRGLIYMMLMVSIVAGAGLMGLKNLMLSPRLTGWLKTTAIAQNAGNLLWLLAGAAVLFAALPARLSTPYYRMIDNDDYKAFVWIRDNIGQTSGRAILDPWKASAFTAITGESVYSRLQNSAEATDEKAYAFLRNGSADTALLTKNGISVVYTRLFDITQDVNIDFPSANPDLKQVAPNVYVLKSSPPTK